MTTKKTRKERNTEWKEKHPSYHSDYYKKNRERLLQKARDRREKNGVKVREYPNKVKVEE
jgi:hypothetical protein